MTSQESDRSVRWTLIGAGAIIATLTALSAAALATGDDGRTWRRAVALCTVVCGFGSMTGWLIARLPYRTPAMAVAGGLGAILTRMVLPLGGLGWLQAGGRDLYGPGADRLMVAFYLVLLATDVILHIIGTRMSHRCRGSGAN